MSHTICVYDCLLSPSRIPLCKRAETQPRLQACNWTMVAFGLCSRKYLAIVLHQWKSKRALTHFSSPDLAWLGRSVCAATIMSTRTRAARHAPRYSLMGSVLAEGFVPNFVSTRRIHRLGLCRAMQQKKPSLQATVVDTCHVEDAQPFNSIFLTLFTRSDSFRFIVPRSDSRTSPTDRRVSMSALRQRATDLVGG